MWCITLSDIFPYFFCKSVVLYDVPCLKYTNEGKRNLGVVAKPLKHHNVCTYLKIKGENKMKDKRPPNIKIRFCFCFVVWLSFV